MLQCILKKMQVPQYHINFSHKLKMNNSSKFKKYPRCIMERVHDFLL